jgi:hypothetical protein
MDNIRDRVNTVSMFRLGIKRKITVLPERSNDIDNQIRLIAYEVKEKDAPPYRTYHQIISLCGASAILRNSKVIEQKDVDLVRTLSQYINRNQTAI